MKVVFSFFLALFVYSVILFFFIYFIFFRPKQQIKLKQVFIHNAITVNSHSKIKNTHKFIKKTKKVIQKKVIKKENKSLDTLAKGGKNIKLEELFEPISDNIKTTKLEHKKKENLTKKIGDYKNSETASDLVNKLKNRLESITNISINSGKKEDGDYISTQFTKIWSSFSTKIDDNVNLYVTISNGKLNISVISTNLDTNLLNQFLTKLREIDVTKIKTFEGIVKFNLKLKEKGKK